jgi:hypothetical protein
MHGRKNLARQFLFLRKFLCWYPTVRELTFNDSRLPMLAEDVKFIVFLPEAVPR